jgi:hypothetical protein
MFWIIYGECASKGLKHGVFNRTQFQPFPQNIEMQNNLYSLHDVLHTIFQLERQNRTRDTSWLRLQALSMRSLVLTAYAPLCNLAGLLTPLEDWVPIDCYASSTLPWYIYRVRHFDVQNGAARDRSPAWKFIRFSKDAQIHFFRPFPDLTTARIFHQRHPQQWQPPNSSKNASWPSKTAQDLP